MTVNEEKKNERVAFLSSLGIHALVFLLLFFMIVWRAPNPPLPEYGIEVNFGTDTEGSGDIQPKNPVGSQGTQEEEPDQPQPQEEEVKDEPTPSEPQPVTQEAVSKIESPVKVEDKEVKKEEPEKPKEKPVEPKKEEPVKPKVDPNAQYKPKAQNESSNKTSEGKAGDPGSHGDDQGKTGDKGNPEGSLDAKALYGQPGGGGGGSSLELSGWSWDRKPQPNVPNNESGRLVFEIKVDENGDIISIKTLERSVSPEAEQACRKAVESLTFTKTGTNVPDISTGKITFVVRAR
jgi:outer membrane biosynthesis protein TonB